MTPDLLFGERPRKCIGARLGKCKQMCNWLLSNYKYFEYFEIIAEIKNTQATFKSVIAYISEENIDRRSLLILSLKKNNEGEFNAHNITLFWV